MQAICKRTYRVEMFSTDNIYYCVSVFRSDGMIEQEFIAPTQKEALSAFERAGYVLLSENK